MPILAEKLQEARPDFRARHHSQFGVAFHILFVYIKVGIEA
jgi:hypothetical protein